MSRDQRDGVAAILAQWRAERPDLDVAPMGLIGRVLRLSKRLMKGLEAELARSGLSFAAFDVLATLRRAAPERGLTASDLAAATMITSGTMTHRIDQLERMGLVLRTPDPADGRLVVVRLSPEGRARIDAVMAGYVGAQARLTEGLTEAEGRALAGLLATWLGALERGD